MGAKARAGTSKLAHYPPQPDLINAALCSKLRIYSQWSDALSVFRFAIEESMHAIIETGGKQYRVASGDVIRVEKLAGEVGTEVDLPVKVAFTDGGELLAGGTAKATITAAGRAAKILVFKFKPKKQYKKTIGHRQSYTDLTIGEIQA
jgi:large subunit ribosomal protein L21